MAQGSLASDAVLATAQTVQSVIPGWQRALGAAADEASAATPDIVKLTQLLRLQDGTRPTDRVADLERTASEAGTTLLEAVGIHAKLLCQRLTELDQWWQLASDASANARAQDALADVKQAQTALEAATLHVLFLAFVGDVRNSHIGHSRNIDTYCAGWGVTTGAIDALWSWLLEDPPRFDQVPVPIVFDTKNRLAYRKTEKWWVRLATVTAPIWSAAAVFGVVALLFELLHGARMFNWPGDWVWRMVVLVLFVWLGALAHVGAQALNVNYSDPMKVYDAGSLLDWISLRWLAVVKMHLPVAVVVASLWGAGNVPTSFQTIGTAILAGYGADSFMSALLSRLGGTGASGATPASG